MSDLKFVTEIVTTGSKVKCTGCKSNVEEGEPSVSVTAVFEGKDASPFAYHTKCIPKPKLMQLGGDYSKIQGYNDLSEDQQKEMATELKAVEKSEKPGTKRKKTDKKDPSEKKEKKPKAAPKEKKKDKEKGEKGEKKRAKKDPNAPKRALSGYMFFNAAMRSTIVEQNPSAAPKDILKLLAEAWKSADAETQEKYKQLSKDDKQRYEKQKAEFDKTGSYTKTEEEKKQEKSRNEAKEKSKEKAKQKAAEKKAKGESKPKKQKRKKDDDEDMEKHEGEEEDTKADDDTKAEEQEDGEKAEEEPGENPDAEAEPAAEEEAEDGE